MTGDFRKDYLKKLRAIVAKTGWAVQAVLGGYGDGGGYSYTVGISKNLGHPEIFMVGFDPKLSQQILNDASKMIKKGASFTEPCFRGEIIQNFDVAFRPVSKASIIEYAGVGNAFLGEFDAVQMFLPDVNGKFPWEEGCDPLYARIQTSILETVGPPPERGMTYGTVH